MKKMYLIVISVLSLFVFSINISSASTERLASTEEYSVQRNDTLWGISKNKLQDPFLWPKLWKANPQIKNPNLLQRGDKIKIPSGDESTSLPQVPLQEQPTVKVKDTIKEEELVEIPVEKPKQPIIDKNLFVSSGFITDKITSVGRIFGSPTGRTVFGTNEFVYLKTDQDVAIGDKFFSIKKVKKVKHPITGKSLGYQIRITGILIVVEKEESENNVSKAQVLASFEDIHAGAGDGLMPYEELGSPVTLDVIRTPDIEGYVVESCFNTRAMAVGNIVYLDKGSNDGLQVGDTFSTFSYTRMRTKIKKTPPQVEKPTGMLQIVALQPTTSKAVILKSNEEIFIGDKWGNE